GLGFSIPSIQVLQHGLLQLPDTGVTATANTALGQLRKESLYQVQPTSTGRREVNVVTRMPRQPPSNFIDLMRAIVVHHQMNIHACWKIPFDLVEKPKELLMPMSPITGADGHSGGHVHGRKQRGYPVPLVILRLPRRDTRGQRQNRLGPIQRLYLALF